MNTIRKMQENKRLVLLGLSAVVVFITAYLLILPALTLEKAEAEKQGGIDVPQAEEQAKAGEAVDAENTGNEAGAEAAYDSADAEGAADAETAGDVIAEEAVNADSGEAAGETPAGSSGELTFDGKGFTVTAAFDEQAGLPGDTQLAAAEIGTGDADYEAWKDEALKALQDAGETQVSRLQFAKFYDISLLAGGSEIEPDAPVDVTISYKRALRVKDDSHLRIIHFAADADGNLQPEVIGAEDLTAKVKKGKMTETAFAAESFSVYAIVYTVDFHYELDGKLYEYSMAGGDSISLTNLVKAVKLDTDAYLGAGADLQQFAADIDTVEFSSPKLVHTEKLEKNQTVGEIITKEKLHVVYPLGLTQKEVLALNDKKYAAGEWVLLSLQPFTSEESLNITMKNGYIYTIRVTDAQDAEMVGDKVKTITNPAGTTIDLFDYWVVNQDAVGRDGWGDLNQGWGGHSDAEGLNGSGNNKGINSSSSDSGHGHALKFSPAWEGTVFNGTKNNWTSLNSNGRNGLNSYTGGTSPFPGIVQDQLNGGYPVLTNNGTIGSNGESLAYLFDPSVEHDGKASYADVDQLLYVDKDGYYTYDSRDYAAAFDEGSGTFTLTEQTSDNSEIRGFWPFGTQNFWSGMHVNTQFSMPAGGTVLNPHGQEKPMQFEFSGDDDTWIYIDGVLIGDGGGIHNRTEIDINFQTGRVIVNGSQQGTLKSIIEAAKASEIAAFTPEEKKAWDEQWDGDTFAEGTYHTFDFFYLERGGGESNLYIHYNLVSTADFTAHKSYLGYDEHDRLRRDQFQFELIGLDGKYRYVKNEQTGAYELVSEDPSAKAIMPNHADTSGKGTVASPYYDRNARSTLSDGSTIGSQIYITGDTEDGNINFGNAIISQADMHDSDEGNPPVYRYIIREVIPDDAVNSEGVTWVEATEQQKAAGGFMKDSVVYDGTNFYMTARVISWEETDARGNTTIRHGLSKTYYTDDTYTTVKKDTTFVNFTNQYTEEIGSLEFTKVKASGGVLPGATFGLFRDAACKNPVRDGDAAVTAVSDRDGKVKFSDVRTGTFYVKETAAPSGYELNPAVYRAVIRTSGSYMSLSTDDSNAPVSEVVNTKPGDLTVTKQWLDARGDEMTGTENVEITLKRKGWEEEITGGEHNISLHLHIDDPGWGSDYSDINVRLDKVVKGDSAVVEWYDCWQGYNSLTVKDASGRDITDYTVGSIDENDHSRRMEIRGITSDVQVEVNYPSGLAWLWQGDKKEKTQNPSIKGADAPAHQVDDDSFAEHVTLRAPGYSHTWSVGGSTADYEESGFDLPKYDEAGRKYAYYAEEAEMEGFETSYQNNDGITEGVITVCNKSERTQTADIKVVKVIKDTEVPLAGAKFTLTQVDGSGHAVSGGTVISDAEVDEKTGELVFEGLTAGRYQLDETVVPDGYIKSEGPYYIGIDADGTASLEDGQSKKMIHEKEAGTYMIENEPGAALPDAGGAGTHWIYLLGAALLLGGGLGLVIRRRMAAF